MDSSNPRLHRSSPRLALAIALSLSAATLLGCRKREAASGVATRGSAAALPTAGAVSAQDLQALEVGPWLPPYVPPQPIGFDLTKTPTLYVVNYAHLDTQWRWSFRETIDELLPFTVHSNIQYFDRFPSHVFSWTGASRYQLIQEYYPEDFELIRAWGKKGRWFPAGNQWEECDVLVPSSESILRQILLGSRFFQREFGTSSQEFMLPDSFGFPASLPSLLAHAGLRGFSTQKLSWQSAVGIPFNVGRWNGSDGRGVIAALNPGSYGAPHRENLSTSKAWLKRLEQNAAGGRLKIDYLYNGTGDIGGAPHEVSMKTVEASLKGSGPVKVKVGPADLMFRQISDAQAAQLPAYQGDLLLTEHSAGSLTSQAFIKQQNRTNELLADAAERASVAAELLGGAPYPQDALEQGWQLTLRSQFHDILPGTSLPKAYEFSWNDEFVAMNRFVYALTDGVAAVARGLDTRVEGVPLVVFNALSVPRTDVVEARIPSELLEAKSLTAFAADGSALPTQVTTGADGERRVLFSATVPAVSFAVYGLKATAPPNSTTTLKTTGGEIANARYRVTVNESGDVSSIFDLAANRELLASPMRHALLTEWPSEFPAWNMEWVDRMQEPRSFVTGTPRIELTENGPVRVSLRVERESEGSLFTQTVRLTEGVPDRVEFVDRIDWMSSACSLKATFPLRIANAQATYNWDLGTVMRGNNHSKQFEVPTHSWLDLTDAKQEYGVSLLTPAKYGSDKPNDNTLRLTLLYTPAAPEYFHEQSTQDWGRHEITYGLVSHPGDWRTANTPWQARRLEQPLLAFAVTKHAGKLGRQFQLLEASNPQVTVQAVKRAEEGSGVIVRLQELWGRPARQHLQFPTAIQEATEMTGIEQKIAPIRFEAQSMRLDFLPNQIRTIQVKLAAPQSGVAAPTSAVVPLDYNLDAISPNAERSDGNCDNKGSTYPAEMLREVISVGGIEYRLGSFTHGAKNALRAEGQTLNLPSGYSRVHLLAASIDGPLHDDLRFGEQISNFSVGPFTGYLGQWDNRIFAGAVPNVTFSVRNPLLRLSPAYLHTDRLAWAASHIHQVAGDVLYSYGYLYSYDFDIPANATRVTLPNNSRLLIFAITVSNDDNSEIRPLSSLWPELTRDARFRQRFDAVGR